MSEIEKSTEDFEEQIAKEIKVDSEGKGRVTISGCARIVGVSHQALSNAFLPCNLKSSKIAQMLVTQGFDPATFSTESIPDLALAFIVKHYAWMAGRYCTIQAQKFDMFLTGVMTRVWMQKVTGWKPTEREESIEEFVAKQLPSVPNVWECRFPIEFWERLHRVYGLKRGDKGCAMFLNAYIYNFFPDEVLERLEEINPMRPEGFRNAKKHQHFDGIMLESLKKQIERVMMLLDMSKDKDDFRGLAKRLTKLRIVKKAKSLPST